MVSTKSFSNVIIRIFFTGNGWCFIKIRNLIFRNKVWLYKTELEHIYIYCFREEANCLPFGTFVYEQDNLCNVGRMIWGDNIGDSTCWKIERNKKEQTTNKTLLIKLDIVASGLLYGFLCRFFVGHMWSTCAFHLSILLQNSMTVF